MDKIFKYLVIAFVSVMIGMTFNSTAESRAMFRSNSYYEVSINQDLLNQRGRRYIQAKAKLNIYAVGKNIFGQDKKNNWQKVHVVMKDQYNNVIWEGDYKGNIFNGNVLKLGNDHDVYRIYVTDIRPDGNHAAPYSDAWQWEIVPVSGCGRCVQVG